MVVLILDGTLPVKIYSISHVENLEMFSNIFFLKTAHHQYHSAAPQETTRNVTFDFVQVHIIITIDDKDAVECISCDMVFSFVRDDTRLQARRVERSDVSWHRTKAKKRIKPLAHGDRHVRRVHFKSTGR